MDHDEAVRTNVTERYLLDELDPDVRDQFEDHLFDCQDCALDVRAAAMFVEHSKVVLAESAAPVSVRVPIPVSAPAPVGWLAWLRPAFAVPVFAALLAVVGYQNLVTVPHLEQAANTPVVLPWVSVNTSTRGAEPVQVTIEPGKGFNLLVSIPPETRYISDKLDLYNPDGKLEWSRTVQASSAEDTRSIYIPGANRKAGTYVLAVLGISEDGKMSERSRTPLELNIQK
jgi:hypothetical protein